MQIEEEIWKPIIGYNNQYEVSNFGNVRSLGITYTDKNGKIYKKKPKILSKQIYGAGYYKVDLNHKIKNIHVLLATAFIPNPENKPTVNHKDGIKTNTYLNNLEWATYSENNKHATDNNLRQSPWTGKFGIDNPKSKPVIQYDKKYNKINEFVNAREAEKITGIGYKHISDCCLGKRKTTGGYIWKYNVQ
jgi:hypothetical protein